MICKYGHEIGACRKTCKVCAKETMRRWRKRQSAGVPCHRLPQDVRFDRDTCYAGDCIIWTGYTCDKRYGRFTLNGQSMPAHRYAYERRFGKVPDGLVLDHLCRNTFCVNPAHLEPVTVKENNYRCPSLEIIRKWQRSKTHCPNGHPYSGENLYVVKSSGWRYCRACMGVSTKKWQLKQASQRSALTVCTVSLAGRINLGAIQTAPSTASL